MDDDSDITSGREFARIMLDMLATRDATDEHDDELDDDELDTFQHFHVDRLKELIFTPGDMTYVVVGSILLVGRLVDMHANLSGQDSREVIDELRRDMGLDTLG